MKQLFIFKKGAIMTKKCIFTLMLIACLSTTSIAFAKNSSSNEVIVEKLDKILTILETRQKEYDAQKEAYQKQSEQYNQQMQQYQEGMKEYQANKEWYESQKENYEKMMADYNKLKQDYEALLKKYNEENN